MMNLLDAPEVFTTELGYPQKPELTIQISQRLTNRGAGDAITMGP